jgi:two-component system, OmpR family, alkaline phosphatase synthesis response regulator PhoP
MGDKKSILICDDDVAILEVTKTILELSGYHVETKENTNNIIDTVVQLNPDLIIMDLWIPEVGGEETTLLLKGDERTRNIPIILFSANNDIERIATKTDAEDFIKKPYEIQELEEKVKKNLEKKPVTR